LCDLTTSAFLPLRRPAASTGCPPASAPVDLSPSASETGVTHSVHHFVGAVDSPGVPRCRREHVAATPSNVSGPLDRTGWCGDNAVCVREARQGCRRAKRTAAGRRPRTERPGQFACRWL